MGASCLGNYDLYMLKPLAKEAIQMNKKSNSNLLPNASGNVTVELFAAKKAIVNVLLNKNNINNF